MKSHAKIIDAQIQNTADSIIVSLSCVEESGSRYVATVILPPRPHGVFDVSHLGSDGSPKAVRNGTEHRPDVRPLRPNSDKGKEQNKSRSALGWSSNTGSTGDDKRL